MEEFIGYILQFGNLNQKQIEFISMRGQECEIKKDEYFAEAGKVFSKVGFILEGIFRALYYKSDGEEITNYFFEERHLLWNWIDLDEVIIPTQYLQAVTPVRLIVFSKKDWKEIAATIIDWDKIIQKIIAKNHAEKLARRSPLISQDAAVRYNDFLEKYPTLVNRIPLSYIASYLGITQSSLSRIRKNSH
jgi:CRP-like cAMP-binding protein